MRNHRYLSADAMLRHRHWSDRHALAAAELHNRGSLSEAQIRMVDAFLAQLAAARRSLATATRADYHRFATSLSRLEKLCRALAVLEPGCTAPAREVLCELRAACWRKSRPDPAAVSRGRPRRLSVPEEQWPATWRHALQALAARTRAGHAGIVIADAGRPCSPAVLRSLRITVAQLLGAARVADLPDELSPATIDAFLDGLAARERRPASKAIRLKELLRWGQEIGAAPEVLDYLRVLRNGFDRQATGTRKRKEELLAAADWGLGDVYLRAQDLHAAASGFGAHLDLGRRLRMDAALLALSVNAPLRIGDLHGLRLGVDIRRDAVGWRMGLRQGKNSVGYRLDRLWPEVESCLDALVLEGRPDTELERRLRELDGCYLFSWDGGRTAVDVGWPSKVWRRHFGTGEHIVRSLWATRYAEHDPDNAPWAAPAHLGHRSEKTRHAYEVEVTRGRSVALAQDMIEAMVAEQRNG